MRVSTKAVACCNLVGMLLCVDIFGLLFIIIYD